jgi:hypothetical protein
MINTPLTWRKSSHSSTDSTCVELAQLADGTVLVRNSNHPDAGTIACTPAEMRAWIAGCRDGELDDLAG